MQFFDPDYGVSRMPVLSTADLRCIMDGKPLGFDFDPDAEHAAINPVKPSYHDMVQALRDADYSESDIENVLLQEALEAEFYSMLNDRDVPSDCWPYTE